MVHFAYILALFWGAFYALFLYGTPWGKTLLVHVTWVATSIGVGVDLLILLSLTEGGMVAWLDVLLVIGLSAIGVIVAGLIELHGMLRRIVRGGRGE